MVSIGALRQARAQDLELDTLSVLKHRSWNSLERSWTESERRAPRAPPLPHGGSGRLVRTSRLSLFALQGRNF